MSYKSYLSFVKVLRVVYPVAGVPIPEAQEQVMDKIGFHWYGDHYPTSLQSRRKVPNFRVSDEAAVPRKEDSNDPAIRFYFDRVPQTAEATFGLLTISPCIRSNFFPTGGSWARNFLRKALGINRKAAKATN